MRWHIESVRTKWNRNLNRFKLRSTSTCYSPKNEVGFAWIWVCVCVPISCQRKLAIQEEVYTEIPKRKLYCVYKWMDQKQGAPPVFRLQVILNIHNFHGFFMVRSIKLRCKSKYVCLNELYFLYKSANKRTPHLTQRNGSIFGFPSNWNFFMKSLWSKHIWNTMLAYTLAVLGKCDEMPRLFSFIFYYFFQSSNR